MSKKHPFSQSGNQAKPSPSRNPIVSPSRSKKPHVIEFGQEVRRRRKELDMTLEQLAERAELTPNYIGAIELGHRDPSLSTIISLAYGLGIPESVLLGSELSLSPPAVDFAELFDSASLELQKSLLMILREARNLGPLKR